MKNKVIYGIFGRSYGDGDSPIALFDTEEAAKYMLSTIPTKVRLEEKVYIVPLNVFGQNISYKQMPNLFIGEVIRSSNKVFSTRIRSIDAYTAMHSYAYANEFPISGKYSVSFSLITREYILETGYARGILPKNEEIPLLLFTLRYRSSQQAVLENVVEKAKNSDIVDVLTKIMGEENVFSEFILNDREVDISEMLDFLDTAVFAQRFDEKAT